MYTDFNDYMEYLEGLQEMEEKKIESEESLDFNDDYISALLIDHGKVPLYAVFSESNNNTTDLYVGKITELEVYEDLYYNKFLSGKYIIIGATANEYKSYRNVHSDSLIKLDNLLYIEEDLHKLKSFCVWFDNKEEN